MGKGDRKTAKGKRSIASYGNVRTHVASKAAVGPAAPVAKKTVTKAAAPAKKAAAKKTVAKAR
ncbi:MAG: 30S ribosomal protein THX [Pseudoxanthomonas sp.]|nr:30S ribosomal protein THX [Pseudoxanthomonas sp.]